MKAYQAPRVIHHREPGDPHPERIVSMRVDRLTCGRLWALVGFAVAAPGVDPVAHVGGNAHRPRGLTICLQHGRNDGVACDGCAEARAANARQP